MKIQVAYKDGTFGELPCVNYHPEHQRHVDQFDTVTEPGGMWTTTDKIVEHLNKINDIRRGLGVEERKFNTPDECVELIDFASVPFEIYTPTGDGAPWKHNGTLVKTIPYGGSDSFWNVH